MEWPRSPPKAFYVTDLTCRVRVIQFWALDDPGSESAQKSKRPPRLKVAGRAFREGIGYASNGGQTSAS